MEHRSGSEDQFPDEQVLAGFIAGDESAFPVLVRRYANELLQFVSRFVRNNAVAEDIVQETFIQVHQSARGFDPQRRFRPWLFTIAANKARDTIRGRNRKREVPLTVSSDGGDSEQVSYLDFRSDPSESPDEIIEANEQKAIVNDVISRMPTHLREVLLLGYYQRFPYKEIAEVLGIPLGTVKSRLHAAVAAFAAAYRREIEIRSHGAKDAE